MYRIKECPYCGRPFVDESKYISHVEYCRDKVQRDLDKQWEKKENV